MNKDLINDFIIHIREKTQSSHPKQVSVNEMLEGFTGEMPKITQLVAWLSAMGCLDEYGPEKMILLSKLPDKI